MNTKNCLLLPILVCLAGAANDAAHAAEPIQRPPLPALKPLSDSPVRDTSVCLGPDGIYYLIGTTGHPTWWNVNEGYKNVEVKGSQKLGCDGPGVEL